MGPEEDAATGQSPLQIGRTMYVLRFFANRYSKGPREPYLSVEAVRKAMQRTLNVELRHDDVKVCVVFLADRRLLEKETAGVTASNIYRASPEGYDYWTNARSLLSYMM